jgi:hypothetical protein
MRRASFLLVVSLFTMFKVFAQTNAAQQILQLLQQKQYYSASIVVSQLVSNNPTTSNLLLAATTYTQIAQATNTDERVVNPTDTAQKYLFTAFETNTQQAKSQLSQQNFNVSNTLFNILQNQATLSYNTAVNQNQTASFVAAYNKFKVATYFYNFTSQNGLGKTGFDTLGQYYGALSAAKANLQVEALLMAQPIINTNLSQYKNTSFIKLYQWLAFFYKQTNNANLLQAITQKSKSLYPTNSFFYTNAISFYKQQNNPAEVVTQLQALIKNLPLTNPTELLNELNNYNPQKPTLLQLQHYVATQTIHTTAKNNYQALLLIGNYFTNAARQTNNKKNNSLALTAFNGIINLKKQTTSAIYIYALQQALANAKVLNNTTAINKYTALLKRG